MPPTGNCSSRWPATPSIRSAGSRRSVQRTPSPRLAPLNVARSRSTARSKSTSMPCACGSPDGRYSSVPNRAGRNRRSRRSTCRGRSAPHSYSTARRRSGQPTRRDLGLRPGGVGPAQPLPVSLCGLSTGFDAGDPRCLRTADPTQLADQPAPIDAVGDQAIADHRVEAEVIAGRQARYSRSPGTTPRSRGARL